MKKLIVLSATLLVSMGLAACSSGSSSSSSKSSSSTTSQTSNAKVKINTGADARCQGAGSRYL